MYAVLNEINERIKFWLNEYEDNNPDGFRLSYAARIEELQYIRKFMEDACLTAERNINLQTEAVCKVR